MTISNTPTEVTVSAKSFADSDDCLQAAADAYAAKHGLTGWDLAPRWADDSREEIVLTVPAFAA